MSRIYDALRKRELERQGAQGLAEPDPIPSGAFLESVVPEPVDLRGALSVIVDPSIGSRLVAIADPHSLGAEKFRALVTRLDNLRRQKELKSLQVTSSVAGEGKTLVSANLALTLAQTGSKVLLVEGDLHKPSLTPLLELTDLQGMSHWWSQSDQGIADYIYRINQLSLWFLPAGTAHDQPSTILQSERFAEALLRLVGGFDWIIVDTNPLLPFADANLWSRLLDGMLLVVREGVASVKALKKGLEAIDNLNLVGVVLNDASEMDQSSYNAKYYSRSEQRTE